MRATTVRFRIFPPKTTLQNDRHVINRNERFRIFPPKTSISMIINPLRMGSLSKRPPKRRRCVKQVAETHNVYLLKYLVTRAKTD